MAVLTLSDEYIRATCRELEEKPRRLFLGRLAMEYGYGGISAVAKIALVCRQMVSRGVKELKEGVTHTQGERNRKPGGGRKTSEETHRINMEKKAETEPVTEINSDLLKLVNSIAEEYTYGDPVEGRVYCSLTMAVIRDEVRKKSGQTYSETTIRRIMKELNYTRLKNQKFNQVGDKHPRRNDQFENIAKRIEEYKSQESPAISIDTKSKEKIGNFMGTGSEWRQSGDPRRVLDHDFALMFNQIYPNGSPLIPDELMNKPAISTPYGVYCLGTKEAYVTIGISSDTSEFAKNSIENWWNEIGIHSYPNAEKILILADGGGSNRSRGNLFKIALQQLADTTGLQIEVCHYPPGCSKYDPIEHKLWPHVSRAWAGKPLISLEAIQAYVSQTKTSTGLKVKCSIDSNVYLTEPQKKSALEKGQPVEGIINVDLLSRNLCIKFGDFEDKDMRRWNYTIKPHPEHLRWNDYRMPDVALES